MSQKIKIQDGIITYAASNPLDLLKFNVKGQLNVSDELTVGNDPLVDGTITSPPGSNINIIPGPGANLLLSPGLTGGQISINGISWPAGSADPTPGYFLGASALNVLEFYPFVLAYNPSDTLSVIDLNTQYPTIQPGQKVIGPSTVYECVSFSTWRILTSGATSLDGLSDVTITTPLIDEVLKYVGVKWINGPGSFVPQVLIIRLTSNPIPAFNSPNFNWFPTILQTSNDASWDVYGSQLSLDYHGWYKITITSTASQIAGANWPDKSTVYGSVVPEAMGTNTSRYFRGNAAGWDSSWELLPSIAQQMSWSDTFFVNVMYSSLAVQIGNYIEMYFGDDPITDVTFDLMMSVQKIENAIV